MQQILSNSLAWCLCIGILSLLHSTKAFALRMADTDNHKQRTNHVLTNSILHINLSPGKDNLLTSFADNQAQENTSNLPCLEGVNEAVIDSNPDTQAVCENIVDINQSLATKFGHIRGDNARLTGNFDGFDMLYQLNDTVSMKGFAGYPNLTSTQDFDPKGYFYGFNTQYRNFEKTWELNSYYIDHHNDLAVADKIFGTAIHYVQPEYSFLLLLDYDLDDKTYAGFSSSGAWKFRQNTTLSTTLDIRNQPIKKRQQTYLRSIMTETDGWSWILPDDRIKQLSKKYASPITSMAFSVFHMISQNLQINGSCSVLSIPSIEKHHDNPTSNPIINEYYYRLKLSANNWIIPGTKNKFDLGHKITDSLRKTTAAIDARYPLTRFWNIQPKIYTERLDNVVEDSVSITTSSTLTMAYNEGHDIGLQIRAGGKWWSSRQANKRDDSFSYYVSLDYRATF